jgi:putative transposase
MSEVRTHGGKREGAGRKKTGKCRDAPHRKRPSLSPKHPVHVTLRIRVQISMRTRDFYHLFRRAMERYLGRDDYRICHISIQHSHLHMIIEAADRRALSRGMQSFEIVCAHAYGAGMFAYRYKAKQVTTKAYARHALSYVLNNWRRHRVDYEDGRESLCKIDPFSSALSFDGWTETFRVPKNHTPLPVSPPRTSLLQGIHGISPYETPGPLH